MKKEEIIAFCELVKNDIINDMVISKTNTHTFGWQEFFVCDKAERESLYNENDISVVGTIFEPGNISILIHISPDSEERLSFEKSYKKLEEQNKQVLKERAIEMVLELRRQMYEKAEKVAANYDMTVEEIVNLPF